MENNTSIQALFEYWQRGLLPTAAPTSDQPYSLSLCTNVPKHF